MKRLLTLSIALLALASPASAKLRVVSTLQDFASIAETIGGSRVEALALAKGYQDPHFVDAKPSFILKLSNADLLIVAGPRSSRSATCRRSSTRAATTRSIPAARAIWTPRSAATSSSGPRGRSRARWATSIPTATRTTGPTPTTAASSPARSRRSSRSSTRPAGRLTRRTWPHSRRSSPRKRRSGTRRWRRTRARRSSRSTTRGRTSPSTSSSSSRATSSPSPASRPRSHTLEIINLIRPEDPDHPRRALLRLQDAESHRGADRRDRRDLLSVRRGRARDQGLLLPLRLRHRRASWER